MKYLRSAILAATVGLTATATYGLGTVDEQFKEVMEGLAKEEGAKYQFGGFTYDIYDRFTQDRMLFWADMPPYDLVDYGVTVAHPNVEGYMVISFSVGSAEFLENPECKDLYWLADNKPVKPHEMRKKYVGNDVYVGHMFTQTEYKQVLNSKKLEFKLCGREFVAPDNMRQAMKVIYRAI